MMDIEKIERLAQIYHKAGTFGTPSWEQAFVRISLGMEVGLKPTQAMSAYVIVSGKPSLTSAGMLSVCQQSGQCEYFRLIESTDKIATYETNRRGYPEPSRFSYSIDDAKRAGLCGRGIWNQHPAAMLRARCRSYLAREVYADLLVGIYSADEIVEFDNAESRSVSIVDGVPEVGPTIPGDTELSVNQDTLAKFRDAISAAATIDSLRDAWANVPPSSKRGLKDLKEIRKLEIEREVSNG